MKRRTQGIVILLIPVIFIGLILLSFVVINTLLQQGIPNASASSGIHEMLGSPSLPTDAERAAFDSSSSLVDDTRVLMNYALGFLGIFAFVMFLPFFVAGIYLIVQGPKMSETLRKSAIVKGLQEEDVEYIDSLSWGAFFGSTVWALSTGLYWWALGTIVPLFNIFVFFKLWIFGREMSWKALQPISFEAFKRRQMIAALIVFFFMVSMFALGYLAPEVFV